MKAYQTFLDFNFIVAVQVLLLVFVASSTNGYGQDDVIRVDTNLVTVPATVIDRNGRYVTNLRKEDFQIFEDGVEQEVALFEPTEQSFTVLVLLDTSGSMKDYIADLARAANAFVSKLRPDDELIAVTFSDQVNTLLQATKVRDLQTGIKIKQRMQEGPTITFDAVDYALKKMKKIRGRKAIVLFSDGEQAGIATAKGTLRDAEEQEALIYTVQFGTFPTEPPRNVSKKHYFKRIEEINGYMRDLALKTGGRYYHIEEIANLEETFGEVAEELGRQYSLGYYPKKTSEAGQRRQIKVKMRQPNLVVRARDSYIIESTKTKQK